jgi:hypothetical protein
MTLDQVDRIIAGVVLLTIVTIEFGGVVLLRVQSGRMQTNALQQTFFRAGHAHAGVLVVLGLVVLILTSAPGVPGWADVLSSGVLWAAILMPAGFFLSVLGRDPARPNRLVALIWVGAGFLAIGVMAAGIGLLVSGERPGRGG